MALSDAKPFAVAAYACDEASGAMLDSVNGYDLTEQSGAIGAASGLLGGARDFEAGDTEYADHADNADLSTGDVNLTVCCYVNLESLTGVRTIAQKGVSVNSENDFEWHLAYFESVNAFVATFSDNATRTFLIHDTFGAASTGTWYSLALVHDATNNEVRLYVDGVKKSASFSTGLWDSTRPLTVGADLGRVEYYDGLIDELVIVKGYAFTDADAAEHHNSGAGVAFADWDAGGGGGGLGVPIAAHHYRQLAAAG